MPWEKQPLRDVGTTHRPPTLRVASTGQGVLSTAAQALVPDNANTSRVDVFADVAGRRLAFQFGGEGAFSSNRFAFSLRGTLTQHFPDVALPFKAVVRFEDDLLVVDVPEAEETGDD